MGETGILLSRDEIRSTDFCEGESSGSPHKSTSALSVRETVQIVSICSGVQEEDHTFGFSIDT